ncbi:MAG: MobA/MobL family protein, partial [Hydrococcus sp. RM1_1_31]|nr:MobA/MobL family protein [Hydrococcus sp. RM1_1_31]
TFDYTRKNGVDATIILAPENAPNWVRSRARLWNEVEKVEKRKDSQLAREIDLAIPVELNNFQKQKLVSEFVLEQFVKLGMVADVAFHHLDSHNPHAHILLTMREIAPFGFGQKNRSWNATELLKEQRQSWEIHANRALEQAEHSERIDCRTLEEQGINRIPQIHLGPPVAAMMDKGILTERGEEYLSICVANLEIEALEEQLAATEEAISLTEPKPSIQTAQTTTSSQLNRALGSSEESATEILSDERAEREATEWGDGLDQVIDSLTNSNQRAEELGERLRKPSRKARDLGGDATGASQQPAINGKDDSNAYREAENPTNSHTDTNRTAEDRAREFQQLEERIRSSDRKNRKAGKSAFSKLGEIAAQFGEKIQQFTRNLRGDSEDVEQRQIQSFELDGRIDSRQTDRTAQGNLGYPAVHEPSNLGIQPNKSSQQRNSERDQRQGQQQRDSLRSDREKIKQVEPAPQPSPQQKPLLEEEVNQIFKTAIDALQRYGKERDNKTTFNNSYYQIQKFSVFETYGYRSYLTIDANDGRGRLLTLKGQNFHPSNLKVQENRLTEQDGQTFGTLQAALDYYQQIRQFKQDTEKILRFLGESDPQNPSYGYGTLDGKKYQIISDSLTFRVIAKDGRGEIFNYPNDSRVRHPEKQAGVHLTDEDLEFFSEAVSKLEQYLQQSQNELREHQRERQQGKGLSR